MPLTPGDPKELGYLFALGQAGLEMVAPVVIGVVVDNWLGSSPWGAVIGAVLGLVVGLAHLIVMSNKRPDDNSTNRPRDVE
jgi:F0F1-type ATP synthase assembly protein I